MRIVVSGGGTAGHISPTLATSDALKSLDSAADLLYVGTAGGMEARIVVARGIKFVPINSGKFRRQHSASSVLKVINPATLGPNVRDAGRVTQGFVESIRILRQFKPDVVFCKGGYVSLPVGLAAHFLRIPFVIHESDLVPGLANRTLAKWASKIAVGFPVKNYRELDRTRLVFTGNPVRKEIMGAHRLEGLAAFGLDDKLPTVLVTGGSQGAAQINDVVLGALPELLGSCQIIHQTGEGDFERIRFELGRRGKIEHIERYHPKAFLTSDMGPALAAADLVVARAGANTIAELAMLGKPTVLIPNYQMAGHQVENARMLSRAGAARVLDGASSTPEKLAREIKRVLADEDELRRLGEGIQKFGKPDAAEELARLILEVGQERERARAEREAEPVAEADVAPDDAEEGHE